MKCDDICFTHVLPRLNGTDLKFLDRVNGETRALVKRSTRKKELKWKFKIEEMSSISTLEVAWEHKSLWSGFWSETWFCSRVAKTNKLDVLKWIREKKKFKIEEMSSISTLEVAWENKSLWSGDLCDERSSFCNKVARTNKLELLEWVRDRINIIKRERIIQKRRRRRRRQQLKKLSFSKK